MKQWYFDFRGNFKLVPGHEFEWEAGPPDGKKWLHKGKILEIIPGKKLVHSWEYPGYKGEAKLCWELTAKSKELTLLRLEFEFVQPFEFGVEALRRKNFKEGWKYFVHTALPGYLES
jgi:uncharacterized protein YndB with AHSA1/START domain